MPLTKEELDIIRKNKEPAKIFASPEWKKDRQRRLYVGGGLLFVGFPLGLVVESQ